MYWNTHAFNITTERSHHERAGELLLRQARRAGRPGRAASATSAPIFNPHNPPFTKETYCNDHVFPIGARVFQMFGHNHKHGEHFWANDPNGNLIYDNYSYSDPVIQVYDPPLAYDSAVKAERTVRYCATYNNGVAADGSPDIELVTRASRVPQSAQEFIGKCTPVACVAGKVAAACTKDADCDSSRRCRRWLVRRLPDHRGREYAERDVRAVRRILRRSERPERRPLLSAVPGQTP